MAEDKKDNEFDFLDYYYKRLSNNQERTFFRVLIQKKMGTDFNTFYQWINRGKVPGYAEIIIIDIINNPEYKLPPVSDEESKLRIKTA